MADDTVTPAEAQQEFWKRLRDSMTVMLGINDPGQHTQPMTAFPEEDSNTVWFFTRDDIDLARDAGAGREARMIFATKDSALHADIRGTLDCVRDRARVDKYWGPMVAAWYPQGKDDPHLILLRFVPEEGQVWVSRKGFIRLAFEVAKANLTHTLPKAGGVADVSFRH